MPLVYKTGREKCACNISTCVMFLQGAAEPHSTIKKGEGGKVAAVPACSLLLPPSHLSMLALRRQNIENILKYQMSVQGPDQIVHDPDQTLSVFELESNSKR